MIKRNSKVVKTSAFDYELLIFLLCPWIYNNKGYENVIFKIYLNKYQKSGEDQR